MPEPTKLLSAEEFRKGFIQMNPVAVHDLCYAALTALHEAEQARDAATKRVAELEAVVQTSGGRIYELAHQLGIVDAELSELRAALQRWVKAYCALGFRLDSEAAYRELAMTEDVLCTLAAQPQGERGKALLAFKAATTALADYRPSLHDLAGVEPDGGPLTAFWAAYDALDGAAS